MPPAAVSHELSRAIVETLPHSRSPQYDLLVHRPNGPGLRRTSPPALLTRRAVALLGLSFPGVRALFASADVMSEGGVRTENGERSWFGSTSLLVAMGARESVETVAAALSRDLHARARLLRLAHAEASLRAPRPLGRASCEVKVGVSHGRLRIDVDVQAPLIEARRRGRALSR